MNLSGFVSILGELKNVMFIVGLDYRRIVLIFNSVLVPTYYKLYLFQLGRWVNKSELI